MGRNKRNSEYEKILTYSAALENVKAQSYISETMAKLGYDDALIEEGRNLLRSTIETYRLNQQEESEKLQSYQVFDELYNEMEDIYRMDRKKAKVILEEEPGILKQIGIEGIIPLSFAQWLETAEKFYREVKNDPELLQRISILDFSEEHVDNCIQKLQALKQARFTYIKEKGEAEDATDEKHEAFALIDTWMSRFFRVARIGLEDRPDLLESLSKRTKN